MVPDARRVLMDDLEGLQCAKEIGRELLFVGRWIISVGRLQVGKGCALDLTIARHSQNALKASF
jgi:hypothetical protein